MPRIAHVISTRNDLGGAEVVLSALLRGGATRGWTQAVVNPFGESPGNAGIVPSDVPARFGRKGAAHLWQLPGLRAWTADQLGTFRPDIVHVHLFHALALMATIPRVGETIRVLTHHHGDVWKVRDRRLYEALDRVLGARYDTVIAVSEEVRAHLVGRYGWPPSKVVTIRNGWEGTPGRRREPDEPTIVCTANFRPEKGHVHLLRAFRQVRAEITNARLVLVGDGPLRGALEAEARTLGIEAAVSFEGSVPDVWGYLSAAHVFALPSLSEPLGIAVMEAMAAGLPVVASRTGGLVELVTEGRTGFLIPPRDEAALATRISGLLVDRSLREELGIRAREAASAWKMDATVDAYFDLYDRHLGRA